MKPEFKRIEAALAQVANQNAAFHDQLPLTSGNQTYSFKVSPEETPRNCPTSSNGTVPPFSVQSDYSKAPTLPPLKPLDFNPSHSSPGSASAMYLLREIEATVISWQDNLNQVQQQIQDTYLEGPIVDGWLEPPPHETSGEASKLRHIEIDHLMDYVEEICNSSEAEMTEQGTQDGYRLCGLDQEGRLWSHPCPPEQLPSVSIAIARYHKLRKLLTRKQEIETRLNQLAEALAALHRHFQE